MNHEKVSKLRKQIRKARVDGQYDLARRLEKELIEAERQLKEQDYARKR